MDSLVLTYYCEQNSRNSEINQINREELDKVSSCLITLKMCYLKLIVWVFCFRRV